MFINIYVQESEQVGKQGRERGRGSQCVKLLTFGDFGKCMRIRLFL